MLVIDVDWPVMQKLNIGNMQARYFYLEKKKTIEIYSIMNNILYRYTHVKTNDNETVTFKEIYLGNAIRVDNISHVNEGEWRAVINTMSERLANIETLLERRKK